MVNSAIPQRAITDSRFALAPMGTAAKLQRSLKEKTIMYVELERTVESADDKQVKIREGEQCNEFGTLRCH
jgi:hypothetical protein